MTTDGGSHSSRVEDDESVDSELALALESYLGAAEAGWPIDFDRLVAEHPAVADQLRSCLNTLRLAAEVEGDAEADPLSGPEDGAPPDMRLGDFRLLRPIGRGGMGIVYEAEQLSLHRRVALKVLPFAAALDHHQLQRFQTEAQAAAQLHHTNIVPVFSVGRVRGVHYYAMQFIDGQTLAALIRDLRRLEGLEKSAFAVPEATRLSLADDIVSGRLAPLPPQAAAPGVRSDSTADRSSAPNPSELASSSTRSTSSRAFFRTVAQLGIQAAEALDYAHRMGIVHRDIKPANLLVDVRGNLWITDFGLARMQADAALTLTGDVLGTLRYMSPEQALSRRAIIDHRTDIYSLGVTLYELLALQPAFGGQDRAEILRQITLEEPRSPRRLNPSVPVDLETIVLKAMAKEPVERYASARELAEDLRRFQELKPIKARRPSFWDQAVKWARRHTAVVLATFVILLIAVGALLASTLLIAREQGRTSTALRTATQRSRQARRAVDTMYTDVAEQWLALKGELEPLQRKFLQEALEFYRQLAAEQELSNDPSVRQETARAYNRVAELERRLGRLQDAEAAFRGAIKIQESLVANHPTPDLRLELERTRKKLGDLLRLPGRHAEAEELLARVQSTLQALLDGQPARADIRTELAETIVSLSRLWADTGRKEVSDAGFRKASGLFQVVVDHDPWDYRGRNGLANGLKGLGRAAFLRGEFPKARSELEKAIGHRRAAIELRADDVDVTLKEALAHDHSVLGECLSFMGQHVPAEAALKEAVRLHGELAREFPNAPDYAAKEAVDESSLGDNYAEMGRYGDAEEMLRRAMAVYSRLRRRFPDRLEFRLKEAVEHGGLARLLEDRERWGDAEQEARAAVELFEQIRKLSPDLEQARGDLALSLHILGNALGRVESLDPRHPPPDPERIAEARGCLERSIRLARAVLETDPKDNVGRTTLRGAHHSLASVLALSSRFDEARACCVALPGLYDSPELGALKALELASDCLQLVKTAPELTPPRREEVARAFIALGRDHRRQALSMGSQDLDGAAELAFHLGYRLEPELRDTIAALELARSQVARKPDSGTAWQVLGVANYGAGQWKPARDALEKAVALQPEDVDTRLSLAMALWKSGERDAARGCYQRVVGQKDTSRSRRLCAEAAALLGLPEPSSTVPEKDTARKP
jgi:serine/threonine protein kinase